jgi:prenyltransferase beta subunit
LQRARGFLFSGADIVTPGPAGRFLFCEERIMRLRHLVLAGLSALALIFALVLLLNLSAQSAVAAPVAQSLSSSQAIGDAVAWLATQQDADGGFGDAGLTADVVLALAAANLEPRLMVTTTGESPLDFLAAEAITYTAGGPAAVGKLVVSVVAADGDPYEFAGLDLLATLWEGYSATTGVFARDPYTATSTWDQSLAMLALAAAQEEVPAEAAGALADWRGADGGWPFTPGSPYTDPDSTALALMALLASGRAHVESAGGTILAAEAYLRATQLDSGGWGWGTPSPNSTGLVLQALAALGHVPATWSWTTGAGGNPQADLASLQLPGGAFPGFGGDADVQATAQAIPGLAEAPFPILGRAGMAQRALTWLAEGQNADGGFGGVNSSPGGTAEAVLAFAAAGYDVTTVQSDDGLTPLDYLVTQVPVYSHDGGEVGKLVLAAVAGTVDPRDFGGYNLVVSLTEQISTGGQLGTNSNFKQAIGMLGLSSAGETVPVTVTQWLLDQQQPDGGWEWAAGSGWGSDPDTTAAAIQALLSAGESPTATAVISAVAYLQSVQTDDGGFPASFDNQSNANTTAYAIQALLAVGEDLWAPEWTRDGRTALDALQAFQKADGPFVYQWLADDLAPDDNLAATYQAVPALLERSLPINSLICADGPGNQATVIIDYANGARESICVEFDQAPISGLELLELAGVPYEEAVAFPGMVTQIRDVGCPGDDPYCQEPMYWSYLYWDGAAGWQSYAVGAGDSEIVDGSVDGWHWADWNIWPPAGPGVTPLAVVPFEPVERGADPDQLRPGGVVLPPAGATGAESMPVYVAFGGDLNRNAEVGLLYRPLTGTEWIEVELARGAGAFSATLPIDDPALFEFRGTFADPDGIRVFEWIYLPLLTR